MKSPVTLLRQFADWYDATKKPSNECGWCEVPTPGKSWCSDECLQAFDEYERYTF